MIKSCNTLLIRFNILRKFRCLMYGNNLIWYFWRFPGCCFKGRFISWNQDLQFECDTYRCFQKGACQDDTCENFKVNEVKDGTLFLSDYHNSILFWNSTFPIMFLCFSQDVWSAINALMTVRLSLKKMFVRPSNVKQENTKWSKKVFFTFTFELSFNWNTFIRMINVHCINLRYVIRNMLAIFFKN